MKAFFNFIVDVISIFIKKIRYKNVLVSLRDYLGEDIPFDLKRRIKGSLDYFFDVDAKMVDINVNNMSMGNLQRYLYQLLADAILNAMIYEDEDGYYDFKVFDVVNVYLDRKGRIKKLTFLLELTPISSEEFTKIEEILFGFRLRGAHGKS